MIILYHTIRYYTVPYHTRIHHAVVCHKTPYYTVRILMCVWSLAVPMELGLLRCGLPGSDPFKLRSMLRVIPKDIGAIQGP